MLNISKIKDRIKQPDIVEDPQSLSARAFKKRVLEGETFGTSVTEGVSLASVGNKVATYNDTTGSSRRRVLGIMLTFGGPAIAVTIILAIIINSLNQPRVTVPIDVEYQFVSGVTIPVGSRAFVRPKVIDQKALVEAAISRLTPAYNMGFDKAVTYIKPNAKTDELLKYYNTKMTATKVWQIHGGVAYDKGYDYYTVLYLRSLEGNRRLDGILLQLERVNRDILKMDRAYYDAEATPNDVVIVLSHINLLQK